MEMFMRLCVCLFVALQCGYVTAICQSKKARACYFTGDEDQCATMKCVIGKLQGCDQEVIEEMMGKGSSLEKLQESYNLLCGATESCDIAGVSQCYTGQQEEEAAERNVKARDVGTDPSCSQIKCMVDKLEDCDDKTLSSIGMSTKNIDELKMGLVRMECGKTPDVVSSKEEQKTQDVAGHKNYE